MVFAPPSRSLTKHAFVPVWRNLLVFRTVLLSSAMLILPIMLMPVQAMAKEAVTWMEAVMPPFLMQSETQQNRGYGNVVTDIIREGLSDYKHDTMATNITRHFYKFKQGEKVCSVGLYRTPEREEFMYFSIPSFLTLPAVLIIRKDAQSRFGNRKSVKLAEILNDKQLTVGLSKDRSYGAKTDEVLKQHLGSGNIFEITGQELSLNLFKMLMKDRIDGIIGLPEEALYQAEQLGIRDQVMTLAIEENQRGYEDWLSSVGCSKTPWGKAIIGRINEILLKQRTTERYRAAYERWLDPNAIETYRRVYNEVFLERTR
jgi:uncharacterized protein (TIGR02285 family)